ncbi:toll-like receptor 12 [Amia ocellicauda]|uniref:toll-like receptor 12 n=1 Tax=Amia ocellicauda TaxID=2972642 RepID=UPI0034642061
MQNFRLSSSRNGANPAGNAGQSSSSTPGMYGERPNFVTEPVALTSLDMSFNLIKNICAGQFSCMPSLIDLDLSNNQISTIEEHAFKGLLRLRSLNLQHNKISVVEKHRFEYLRNLKSLSMDWNPLTRIEEGAFENQVSLEDLSLGNLETLVSMLNLTSLFKRLPENLTDLSINVGRGSVHIAIGGDSHPSAGLTLSLRGRSVSFVDCHRPFFEHVIEVHAKTEQLRCGSDFMAKYVPNVKDFEYISELSATFIDYTDLNSLTKLRRLILVNINLFEQPNLPLIFRNLSQLETLVMVNCRIPSLEISLTKDLTSLKSFALHIANPVSWGNGLFDAVADLKFLYLIHLNVYCLCENAWFVTWAKAQTGLQALVWKPDLQDVTCPAAKGTANFLQFVQGSCVFETEFILFVSTACGLLFFMSAVLIYNLAGAYLLALFYILRGWLANLTRRGDAGRRYQFDAFVSYCGKDEDWVLEELLPNLEQRGPPFLRLCLHSRDFQPGKDVVDNITDSIYSSRRTLCVVSRHSLQSGWCSLEMRLATYRLQVERRDVLMLLFLEEIPPVLLSAHHRLARLVKTRTYLDWPQDERQRPAFWDRLQAKIASGRPTD